MKCNLSTVNGWCGIFNRLCKEWTSSQCKFIKKAYRQGRVEGEYFSCYKSDWTPVSKRLPTREEVDEDNRFLVTQNNHSVGMYVFNYDGNSEEYWKRNVIAWKPLPKPYKESEE